jgi:hypothetical protein
MKKGSTGKVSLRPTINTRYVKPIKTTEFSVAAFQLNSLLAVEATKTRVKIATRTPIVGKRMPNRQIEPVMIEITFQLNGGILSIVALAPRDFTRIKSPKRVIRMPKQNGK